MVESHFLIKNHKNNIVGAQLNIAKSEQSSHNPGGSHQRPYHFNLLERKKNGQIKTDKQYVADSFIHSTTCHI